MKSFPKSVSSLIALVVALSAVLAITTAASPAAGTKKVYWIDLAGTAKQHPDFVYFVADAGGQVHSIHWKNWGAERSVGKGVYHDTSAHYPGKPNQEGRGKLIATKPVKCTPEFGSKKGKDIYVYRHVKLIYPNGKGGRMTANVSATAGYLTCK